MWRALATWFGRDGESLGARGERAAAEFLKKAGYRVVGRNVRLGRDEADIVAFAPDGFTLVIVEVKTRRADRIAPEEHVNPTKQLHLARVAQRLHRTKQYENHPIRFDVIAIVWPEESNPEVRHHIAAFHSPF